MNCAIPIEAKKQRKTIEWERLEISIKKKKREIKSKYFMQRWASVKDRNGTGLTDAEDIKKRWQEYTEELYKNIFRRQIITMV